MTNRIGTGSPASWASSLFALTDGRQSQSQVGLHLPRYAIARTRQHRI